MGNKIQNKFAGTVLYQITRISESEWLAKFHQLGRECYLSLLLPWLQRRFQSSLPKLFVSLTARHSVLESGKFNLFLSDLDLTLTADREPNSGELQLILDCQKKLESWIPFLGELEIYTQEESSRRKEILHKHRTWIDMIWNLRKWVSQSKAYLDAPTNYHRYKALQSISKIKTKLGSSVSSIIPSEVSLAEILHPHLKGSMGEGPKITAHSEFLQWELKEIPLGFVALLPDSEFFLPAYAESIADFRRKPEVGQVLAAIACWERLLCRNRGRLFAVGPSNYDQKWQNDLLKLEEQFRTP